MMCRMTLCLALLLGSQSVRAQDTAHFAKSYVEAQIDARQAIAKRNAAEKAYHDVHDQKLKEHLAGPELEQARHHLSSTRKAYNDARLKALHDLETTSPRYRELHQQFEALEKQIREIHRKHAGEIEPPAELEPLVDQHLRLYDEINHLEQSAFQKTSVPADREKFIAATKELRKLEGDAHVAAEKDPQVARAREQWEMARSDADHAQRAFAGAAAGYQESKEEQAHRQQMEAYRTSRGWYGGYPAYPYRQRGRYIR